MIPNPKDCPTCGPRPKAQVPVDPDEEALARALRDAFYGTSEGVYLSSGWLKVARKARKMLKVKG